MDEQDSRVVVAVADPIIMDPDEVPDVASDDYTPLLGRRGNKHVIRCPTKVDTLMDPYHIVSSKTELLGQN
jgi:hypothetical protein